MSFSHVVCLSDASASSLRRGLDQLFEDGVVNVERIGTELLCSLNENSLYCELIREVFKLERSAQIREKSKKLSKKAQSVIKFCDEALALFTKAKEIR